MSSQEYWDPEHDGNDEPAPAARPPTATEPCWRCTAPVPVTGLSCPSCGVARTHLVLSCTDPHLELSIGTGERLAVGRDPDWARTTAALLKHLTRVSRRHLELWIEDDGSGWAEEWHEGTRNGTYVGGTLLSPGVPTPLRDGDELRIGHSVATFLVRLHGPAPAAVTGRRLRTGPSLPAR